jgi:hypothetical protein
MGNFVDLPNIALDSFVIEGSKTSDKKNGVFDAKNYLNTRLADGEEEKTITIRLLPMDLKTGNPFVIVHTHNVKVPSTMVKPGEKPYKSYICLAKNADINHEKFGNKCPFCEINREAYLESTKLTDPQQIESYRKVSLANLSREAVICRCIERGKEDEGVKFWKFNLRTDKTDPCNQIIKLAALRREEAERKGKVNNILDIYEGRDLNITFTAEGTSAPTVVDDSDRSPLSENEELMKKWIYDEKKWQDVFTCKPYEYLWLVSQMKTPWYDKANNVWVDKDAYDNVSKGEVASADAEIEAAHVAMVAGATTTPAPTAESKSIEAFRAAVHVNDDPDELPF